MKSQVKNELIHKASDEPPRNFTRKLSDPRKVSQCSTLSIFQDRSE